MKIRIHNDDGTVYRELDARELVDEFEALQKRVKDLEHLCLWSSTRVANLTGAQVGIGRGIRAIMLRIPHDEIWLYSQGEEDD